MTVIPVETSGVLWSAPAPGTFPSPSAPSGLFDKLCEQLDGLSGQLVSAEQSVKQLAEGHTENLHQVMIQLEQARMSFELALQVRNKVLDAYQEIMRMQV